jgi:hypothetical protein
MHSFLLRAAVGIGMICSFAGWCALIVREFRSKAGFKNTVRPARRSRAAEVAAVLLLSLLSGAGLIVLDLADPVQSTAAFSPPTVHDALSVTPGVITAANSAPEPAGPVVNLNPDMKTPALQSALRRAPRGATIRFAAGTYDITSTLVIPCNDLQITGPVADTPAAILSASYKNGNLFGFEGGCESLGGIKYLHFQNTGAVYFGAGDNSNFTFEHNLVTNLPSGLSNLRSESGLYFDGSLSTRLKNVVIRYNTFGDPQSCSAVFATVKDEGGYCSGILTSEGEVENLTIEHNNFTHIENGVHIFQLAQFVVGERNGVCISCTLEYNYIWNYHRIGIEIQVSTPTNAILVEHNAIVDPINSSWGTFAVSMACCQWNRTLGSPGFSPGYIFDDNVLVATLPVGSECPPYGVEFWGNGPQGTNSLVQGTFCNGYTWGFGAGSWAINHNYICGPDFASKGGYISNQQKQSNPPEQSGNVVAPKCSATASIAPAISPAGGSFSASQVVTLSDPGLNTAVWYTIDGSTPVPGSGAAQYYTGPFTITNNTTVKAVGMWGAPNQPVRYPSGYGYIPSSVVSASFIATSTR